MGEKFRRVVLDFVQETGTAARQLALWAGRTETAVRNWKDGTATPEPPALARMLEHIPEPWRTRFQDAWDEDESPQHIWERAQRTAAAEARILVLESRANDSPEESVRHLLEKARTGDEAAKRRLADLSERIGVSLSRSLDKLGTHLAHRAASLTPSSVLELVDQGDDEPALAASAVARDHLDRIAKAMQRGGPGPWREAAVKAFEGFASVMASAAATGTSMSSTPPLASPPAAGA